MKKIVEFFKRFFKVKEELVVEISKRYKCIDSSNCTFIQLEQHYYGFIANNGSALDVVDDSGFANIYGIGRFELC